MIWRRAVWEEAAGCCVLAQLTGNHRAPRGACSSPRVTRQAEPQRHSLCPTDLSLTMSLVGTCSLSPPAPWQQALLLWGRSTPPHHVWMALVLQGWSWLHHPCHSHLAARGLVTANRAVPKPHHALHFSYRCYRHASLLVCMCSYSSVQTGRFWISICHMQVWLNWGESTARHPSPALPQAQRSLYLYSHCSTKLRLLLSLQS